MVDIKPEREYALARRQLSSVFPESLMSRGSSLYSTQTRFEGANIGTSRLVHIPSGTEVGHISWNPENGNILQMNVDPTHSLMGINSGRLLHEAWRSAELMGYAGPIHGTFDSSTENRLRDKLRGELYVNNDEEPHVGVALPQINQIPREIERDRNRNSQPDPERTEQRYEATQSDLWTSNVRGAVRMAHTTLERANNLSEVPDQQSDEAREDQRRRVIAAHSEKDSGDFAPVISYSNTEVPVNRAIGRPPQPIELSIPSGGRFCTSCNNHHQFVAVASLPYSGSGDSASIINHVRQHIHDDLNFTYSSAENRGVANPMGGRSFTNSLAEIPSFNFRPHAAYVFPSSLENGRVNGLTVQLPLTCPICD